MNRSISVWGSLCLIVASLAGCAATGPDGKRSEDIYIAPEPALGSNLARRGERRTSESREVTGEALESLKQAIPVGPIKGVGN